MSLSNNLCKLNRKKGAEASCNWKFKNMAIRKKLFT